MDNKISLIILTSIFCIACGHTQSSNGTSERCLLYCPRDGNWYPSLDCHGSRPYCCGLRRDSNPVCCSDKSQRGGYRFWWHCPYTRWWELQWRVIIGMLVSLIVMLCCVACCYYCCAQDGFPGLGSSHSRRRTRRGDTESVTVSYSVDNEIPRNASRVFDPQSPYAFEPPSYESLPKEPPKYAEIFLQGQDNAAFDATTGQVAGNSAGPELPPGYSNRESAAGERNQGGKPASVTPTEGATSQSRATSTSIASGAAASCYDQADLSMATGGARGTPSAPATSSQGKNVQHDHQPATSATTHRQDTLAPVNT